MTTIDFDVLATIKGFMDDDEVRRLYEVSLMAADAGPILEIGSYCGKSAYIIGTACRRKSSVLYSIDHHKGNEEQQPGEEYFDKDLFDSSLTRINTFPFFQNTLKRTGLEDTVVPIVSSSAVAGKMWKTPLAMLFIDGGHSFEAAHTDFLTWAYHIQPSGFLVIHDIFFDPEQGGQAPRQVYEIALASGDFEPLEMIQSLGVLKRKSAG